MNFQKSLKKQLPVFKVKQIPGNKWKGFDKCRLRAYTEEQRLHVLELFTHLEDNRMTNIAKESGVLVHDVSKILNDRYSVKQKKYEYYDNVT